MAIWLEGETEEAFLGPAVGALAFYGQMIWPKADWQPLDPKTEVRCSYCHNMHRVKGRCRFTLGWHVAEFLDAGGGGVILLSVLLALGLWVAHTLVRLFWP